MKITDFGYPSKREVHCRFGSTIMYTCFQPNGDGFDFFDTNTYDAHTAAPKIISSAETEEILSQLAQKIIDSPQYKAILEDFESDPYDDYRSWMEDLEPVF
jgi:hypothetical protein